MAAVGRRRASKQGIAFAAAAIGTVAVEAEEQRSGAKRHEPENDVGGV